MTKTCSICIHNDVCIIKPPMSATHAERESIVESCIHYAYRGKPYWIRMDDGYHRCSYCGYTQDLPNYKTRCCPKCKCDMEGTYDD